MKDRQTKKTIGALCLAALLLTTMGVGGEGQAPTAPPGAGQKPPAPAVSRYPDIAGMWYGNTRARPMNSENFPWTKANFPVLNERGLAYMKAFDEAVAPKYDCVRRLLREAIRPVLHAGRAMARPNRHPLRKDV